MPRPSLHAALPKQSEAAGPWTVTIPDFHPKRLNELLGNYHRAGRLKASDRKVIGAYCRLAGVPEASRKRRVRLRIVLGKGQRGADPDAYWKSSLDALKHCGAIKDDRKEMVEIVPVEYDRAARAATVITIEEIGGDRA